MMVSAELRWFWKNEPPKGLDTWFRSGRFPVGGGRLRRDEYLIDPSQIELGIKKRGGGSVELKGLVCFGRTLPKPFEGRIQLWSKWSSNALSIDRFPRLVVAKTRWLRKFDTGSVRVQELELGEDEGLRDKSARPPDCGCLLELVAIETGDDATRWWSLAFEAFGPLDSVEASLERTAMEMGEPSPPSLENASQLSYPEWLSRLAAVR